MILKIKILCYKEIMIIYKDRELNNCLIDLKNQKNIINSNLKEKDELNNTKENLINEILRLREANDKLVNQLNSMIESDLKIKQLIDRKEKINGLIKKNKKNIERSLNSFNNIGNNSNNNVLNNTIQSAAVGFVGGNGNINSYSIINNSGIMDKSAMSYSPRLNVSNQLNLSS